MRINEQGRSMIEMLGVLAIVGVLSVGGIAGYSKAMNKFKTNKVIDQVNMLATNIRTLYSSQRTYNGLNNYVAINTGAAPAEMYDQQAVASATPPSSASVLTNAFSGHVQISPAGVDSDDDEMAFIIAIDAIPSASCVSIVTTDWGGEAGSGLAAMKVAVPGGTGDDAVTVDSVVEAISDKNSSLTPAADLAVQGDDQYGFPFSIINATTSCGRNQNAAIAWKFM